MVAAVTAGVVAGVGDVVWETSGGAELACAGGGSALLGGQGVVGDWGRRVGQWRSRNSA